MGQRTLVLANAHMLGGAGSDPGPTHTCVPGEDGALCTIASECGWLRRWRREVRQPLRLSGGICDWGDCTMPAVSERLDPESGRWLPVCASCRGRQDVAA